MRTGNSQSGITLIESVTASVLLMLTFGALLLSFMRMSEMSLASQNSLAAMHIARTELEALTSVEYSNIVAFTNVALTNTVLEDLEGQKHCDVVITTNNYKEVTVMITWRNPGRPDASSLSLATLIGDYD